MTEVNLKVLVTVEASISLPLARNAAIVTTEVRVGMMGTIPLAIPCKILIRFNVFFSALRNTVIENIYDFCYNARHLP